jgi:hypothetical protein
LTLVLLALGSCASSVAAGPSVEARLPRHPDALFELRARGCDNGSCPVFSVAVYTDGQVIFDGRVHVKAIGRAKGELASANVGALLDAFRRVDFLDTPAHCCECPDTPVNPRASQATLAYRPGGVEKEIAIDERCADLPTGIRTLVDQIEGLSLVAAWIGLAPKPLRDSGAATETRL